VPRRLIPEVERYLEALGALHEQGLEREYEEVAHALSRMIGVPALELRVVDSEERAVLDHQVVEREPGRSAPDTRRRPRQSQ
jgi:hypothetical protein